MISPSWPQIRPHEKFITNYREILFLDVIIAPSLKANIKETPLSSINPLDIQSLLNLSQISKGLV